MKTNELQNLLAQMSIEEKAAELLQLPASFFTDGNMTGPAMELGIDEQTARLAGSCLSVTGAAKLKKIQQKHIAEHPHHIPMLFMADVINGFQTIFPIPLAQGCTFDPDMVETGASIAAREACSSGIHVTFSPMADLVRDPRWGRVMEATGESSYLNGKMAVAMIHGYQGKDNTLHAKGHLAACLKHFAGYGAPEGGRDYNTVELSSRTFRDSYLPAYKEAINAGCTLVMTSFNTLDRIPSSANKHLLQDILRDEMNFTGVIISDWQAVAELIAHGIAENEAEAARLALSAGVDIDMATSIYVKQIQKLIEQNLLSEKQLDESVLRILELKNKLRLFENPYKDADEADEQSYFLSTEHRLAAQKCAEESFVLLKNEQSFLPLNTGKDEVAFIGPYVDWKLLNGSWSFFADDKNTTTLKDALQACYPSAKMQFLSGCPMTELGVPVIGFQVTPPKDVLQTEEDCQKAMKEAIQMAKSVEKIVLCLGEHREFSGEAASKADITLPACQLELFERIYEVNPNICVVLFNGRPLDIRPITEKAMAIIEVWLPGTEGGNAIAHTLYGENIPSGKLSMSFPYSVGQIPVYHDHMNTGRPFHGNYKTDRFASKYLDIPNEPSYAFGYGLSYTRFSYSAVSLDCTRLRTKDSKSKLNQVALPEEITATITLTNIGDYTATEVVQLYIRDKTASVVRPTRELKGFQRITLCPGKKKEVSFVITEEMLRFYNVKMDYCSEPGEFTVYIGTDSTTMNSADFTLF